MPSEQDETGQWWYVCRKYRSRAYPRTCLNCGSTFYCRKSDRFRFCSKRCAQLGSWSPHWKGGRHTQKGYVLIRLLDDNHPAAPMRDIRGYVPEHRLIMAQALGRPLSRRETVHHVNGDKLDNRLENLELRSSHHGPGVRFRCIDCGSSNVHPAPLSCQEECPAEPSNAAATRRRPNSKNL
jgi:HNH endonuclease